MHPFPERPAGKESQALASWCLGTTPAHGGGSEEMKRPKRPPIRGRHRACRARELRRGELVNEQRVATRQIRPKPVIAGRRFGRIARTELVDSGERQFVLRLDASMAPTSFPSAPASAGRCESRSCPQSVRGSTAPASTETIRRSSCRSDSGLWCLPVGVGPALAISSDTAMKDA
jgi:hypothetical protein